MFMPVTDPAISLAQAIEITKKQNAAIQNVPGGGRRWSRRSRGRRPRPIPPRST